VFLCVLAFLIFDSIDGECYRFVVFVVFVVFVAV
jgi:hypothetical protein